MSASIDCSDVPHVGIHDLYMPMRHLIEQGRGLAMLNGLSEADIRVVESQIWAHFDGQSDVRLAVALRFRALLKVFATRRLRQEFLHQGFKLIARAVAEASTQRLNTRFGFSAQRFVSALTPEQRPVERRRATEIETLKIAA
jgi:hypothetical protein